MLVTLIKSDRRAREKPCLCCGYSLRKIESSHCPECGLSVWLSLNQNDLLDWSRPDWLRTMIRGLLVLLVAQLIAMIAYGLVVPRYVEAWQLEQKQLETLRANPSLRNLDEWTLRQVLPPRALASPNERMVWRGLAAGYLLFSAAGLALLTMPERRYPDKAEDIRLGAWISAGFATLVGLLILAGMQAPLVTRLAWILTRIAAAAVGITTWLYLATMARRLMKRMLSNVSKWICLVPALMVISIFTPGSVGDLLHALFIVFVLGSAVLLIVYAHLFNLAAREACRNWQAETRK